MAAKIRGESSGDLHYGSLPAIARRVGFVYKGDDAGHVGTYSQDFYRALGQEPRTTIDPVDMFGALTGAVKSLDKKVNKR